MSQPAESSTRLLERGQPLLFCDGQDFKLLAQAGLAWLQVNREFINTLNVFPVPDGDSGTNLALTLQAAWKEIENSPSRSVSEVMNLLARGALMGARGNSGVILSQLLRGMAKPLEGKPSFNGIDFAESLREGSRLAYLGVQKPVEGTILTVAREAAEAAARAAAESEDLYHILAATVAEAQRSVARTQMLNPVNAKAGVVDAGGQGLFIIFQGALKFMNGEAIEAKVYDGDGTPNLSGFDTEAGYGFDIQFILRGKQMDVDAIRAQIESIGESVLVVGDPNLIKVHAHAPTPGPILDYGAAQGIITRIIVENMEEQYQERILGQARPSITSESLTGIGTIVVVSGAGLQQIFQSMGASRIVSGGATMNPSVQDLLKAVEEVDAQAVIILPNDKNIVLAAQHVQQLTKKVVHIIPTVTVPQGIAALLAFNFQANLETNVQAMMRATAGNVQTAEITRAVRSITLDGLECKEGEFIGLLNGRLTASHQSLAAIAHTMLEQMGAGDSEIITVYHGADVSSDDAARFADEIRQRYPRLEVEVLSGGQPHYFYILSAE